MSVRRSGKVDAAVAAIDAVGVRGVGASVRGGLERVRYGKRVAVILMHGCVGDVEAAEVIVADCEMADAGQVNVLGAEARRVGWRDRGRVSWCWRAGFAIGVGRRSGCSRLW